MFNLAHTIFPSGFAAPQWARAS